MLVLAAAIRHKEVHSLPLPHWQCTSPLHCTAPYCTTPYCRRCWSLYYEYEVEFASWQELYSATMASQDAEELAQESAALAQRTLPLLTVRACVHAAACCAARLSRAGTPPAPHPPILRVSTAWCCTLQLPACVLASLFVGIPALPQKLLPPRDLHAAEVLAPAPSSAPRGLSVHMAGSHAVLSLAVVLQAMLSFLHDDWLESALVAGGVAAEGGAAEVVLVVGPERGLGAEPDVQVGWIATRELLGLYLG